MCNTPSPRLTTRRAGFTLVELLVAIVLIDVGVLALVAESAALVRTRNELRMRAVAARMAGERVQLLSAQSCAAASGSATSSGGLRERWSVALVPSHTREIRDSVEFLDRGATRAVVLRTRLPC